MHDQPWLARELAAMASDPARCGTANLDLPPLLARGDLAPDVVAAACAVARTWLAANPTAPHASYILQPLLARADLHPDDADAAIRGALAWLDRIVDIPTCRDNASRVLCALLGRRDAPPAAAPLLERWTLLHGLHVDADRVYKAVCTGKILPTAVLVRAVEWLEAAGDDVEIDFVANRLLTLSELPDEAWQRGAQVMLRWLKHNAMDEGRGYILVAVARRLHLLSAEQRAALAADIRRFLAARFPLPAKLDQRLRALAQHIEEGRDTLSLARVVPFNDAIDDIEAELNAGRTPTVEALQRLLDMAVKQTMRAPEAVGYAVPCLLAGADRHGPPLSTEVERWVASLWGALRDAPRARDGLSSAIRRRRGDGWWRDAPHGMAATILGHGDARASARPLFDAPRASDSLKAAIAPVEAALSAGSAPTVAALRELLARAEERRLRSLESAGYAAPPLLAGAAHHPELRDEIERWATALWNSLADLPRAREGLRHACLKKLEAGWWPGPPQGITVLILNTRAPRPSQRVAPRPRRST